MLDHCFADAISTDLPAKVTLLCLLSNIQWPMLHLGKPVKQLATNTPQRSLAMGKGQKPVKASLRIEMPSIQSFILIVTHPHQELWQRHPIPQKVLRRFWFELQLDPLNLGRKGNISWALVD